MSESARRAIGLIEEDGDDIDAEKAEEIKGYGVGL